jgi:hypothetical protein
VVEACPKTRADEGAGAGILTFLESMTGGASLRGVAGRPGAAPALPPAQAPPAQPAFPPGLFAPRSAPSKLRPTIGDDSPDGRRSSRADGRSRAHAALAARSGEQELMMLRFPSDLCSDRGRKIDIAEKGWEETLRGEVAEIFSRWREELKPRGLGLSARVVMPGRVAERRRCAYDQELAQISIAHLADAPRALLAAARVLARRKAEKGGKRAAARKRRDIADRAPGWPWRSPGRSR